MCTHEHESAFAPSRRRILAVGGGFALSTLAGCLGGLNGDTASAPAAVAIGAQAACDECGMVISKHPGPNGQLFWEDHEPADHDPPYQFDSLKQCLFPHYFEKREQGWTLAGMYVTDYSTAEYTVSMDGDRPFITSHTDAESFAPASDLVYVVDSDIHGAMGPDFVPFSEKADAESFAGKYGGTVVSFDQITPTLAGK
jgi:nitrous oxide reductase accessory protein NosL